MEKEVKLRKTIEIQPQPENQQEEGSNATESLLDGFIAIGSQLEGSSASESQLDGFISIR
jgi:hypothetical protein